MIWIYCYLLNGIEFDLDLHNSGSTREIPNFPTSNINIWFFTHHTLSDLIMLDLRVLQIASRISQERLHTFLMASLLHQFIQSIHNPSSMSNKIRPSLVR